MGCLEPLTVEITNWAKREGSEPTDDPDVELITFLDIPSNPTGPSHKVPFSRCGDMNSRCLGKGWEKEYIYFNICVKN
jgi:hypothetical protein